MAAAAALAVEVEVEVGEAIMVVATTMITTATVAKTLITMAARMPKTITTVRGMGVRVAVTTNATKPR
jgi:hypothetical protein